MLAGRPTWKPHESSLQKLLGWTTIRLQAILKAEGHPTWHPTLAYVRGNSKGTSSSSSEQPQRQSSDTGVYGPGSDTVTKSSRRERRRMKHGKGNIFSLPILSHMKCNCDASDIDVMFRKCCVSVDGCMDALQCITLFDTGAHMSYVSRQVAA